jgi:hypothetical protein
LKENKIAEQDIYLEARIAKMPLDKAETCWTLLPEQYVKAAVTNAEEDLTYQELIAWFQKLEQGVVSGLAQDLLVVPKTETNSSFGPNSGTISSLES